MNTKKARTLRKKIFGDQSHRHVRYEYTPAGRVCVGFRAKYRKAKKEASK